MPKQKRAKRQQTVFRDGVGPTPEQLSHGNFVETEAPRIPGHDHGNVRTMRRVPPIEHWQGKGLLSQRAAAAMTAWHNLLLIANYDRVASCCDDTPRGSGGGMRPDRMIDAGREHARIKLELVSMIGPHMARELCHFLEHDGTLTQAYREAYEPLRLADCFMRAERAVAKAGHAFERIK
jgi:hypothetical protein